MPDFFRFTILFFLLLLFCLQGWGQDNSAQKDSYCTLSGGAGVSGGAAVIKSRVKTTSFLNNAKNRSSVVFAGAFERRIGKTWGIGFAFSQQTFTITSMEFGQLQPITNYDHYTRTNYAVRGLLYMGSSPKWDFYWALRLGYTFWKLDTNSGDVNYIKMKTMPDSFSGQIAYGMRYYAGLIGFGAEIGIGSAPYIMLASICLKFPDN
jgi:hypothetical protein